MKVSTSNLLDFRIIQKENEILHTTQNETKNTHATTNYQVFAGNIVQLEDSIKTSQKTG